MYSSNYAPQFAYDGLIETIYVTKHTPNNWVKFNLEKLHAISKIVVIGRTDGWTDQINNTEINVARMDTEKTSTCGKIRSVSTELTVAAQTHSLNCNGAIGDHVLLSKADPGGISGPSLAEITIFGFAGT